MAESYPPSRPETPVGELPSSMSLFSFHSSSSRGRSRSSILSDFTSSDSSSVSRDGKYLCQKLAHNTSIILLRIHRSLSFGDLRAKNLQQIRSTGKAFHFQQHPLLSHFLPPVPTFDYSKPRSRNSFMSSACAYISAPYLHIFCTWMAASIHAVNSTYSQAEKSWLNGSLIINRAYSVWVWSQR